MEKTKEKKVQPKLKEYFTVKVEVLTPVILTYKILSETPELAAKLAAKKQGQEQSAPPKINYAKQVGKAEIKVYKAGTTMLQLTTKS